MVATRRRAPAEEVSPANKRRPTGNPAGLEEEVPAEAEPPPLSPSGGEEYVKLREERIKENAERMKKLGIIDLSDHMKKSMSSPSPLRLPASRATPASSRSPCVLDTPSRRSSRLQNVAPVTYAEVSEEHEKKATRSRLVRVEGPKEIYTKEHEKMLGTCDKIWTLYIDGYGKDGKRVYDQIKGKTCHQCRQKTLGLRTHCSQCQIIQGQFCGDCLYTRYGENVLEANKNPSWICPVCRGICNCSICRLKNGWLPTGYLYNKIVKLGFKSVAHYLIQTRQCQAKLEDPDDDGVYFIKKSLSFVNEPTLPDAQKSPDYSSSVDKHIKMKKLKAVEDDLESRSKVAPEKKGNGSAMIGNTDSIAGRTRGRSNKPLRCY